MQIVKICCVADVHDWVVADAYIKWLLKSSFPKNN